MPSRLFSIVEDETPLRVIAPRPASTARPTVNMDSVNQLLHDQGYGTYATPGLPTQPASSPTIRPLGWYKGLSRAWKESGEIVPLPILQAGDSGGDCRGVPPPQQIHPRDSEGDLSRALKESRVILPSTTTQLEDSDEDNRTIPPPSTLLTIDYTDTGLSKALAESRAMYNNRSTTNRSRYDQSKENNLILELGNEFAPLLDPQGDTLIYIGAPPRVKEQSLAEYTYVEHHFRQLHRVSSQQLKATGSKVFEKFLGPKSIRTERRLRKEGILDQAHTSGIKFYIDLRPPSEEDEAILLLTELTCTQGILRWHKSQKKYGIAKTMVCGRDDFAPLSARLGPSNMAIKYSPFDTILPGQLTETSKAYPEIPSLEPEAEYSALRHRSAIERVMQAIALGDPKLDSAPKLWTYFAVAKSLDCATHERVNGWIAKWLYTPANMNFIQNNPEVVYRIGLGIRAPHLTRDAFSMLAGEKALLNVCYEDQPALLSYITQSVHGRTLELLDDDECNRIDHAATSLARRVRAKFEKLVEKEMKWLELSEEYRKIFKLKPNKEKDKAEVEMFDQKIKDYVRGRLQWTLARNMGNDFSEFDQKLDSVKEFRSGLPFYFGETYERLTEQQRLLTRTFWIALSHEKIQEGDSNIFTPYSTAKGQTKVQYYFDESPIVQKMYQREAENPGTGLVRVTFKDLMDELRKFNNLGSRYYSEEQNAIQDQERISHRDVQMHPNDVMTDGALYDFDAFGGASTPSRVVDPTNGPSNLAPEDDCMTMSYPKRSLAHEKSSNTPKDKRRRLSEDQQVPTEIDRPSFTPQLPLRVMNLENTVANDPSIRTVNEKHGSVWVEDFEDEDKVCRDDEEGESDSAELACANELNFYGRPSNTIAGQETLQRATGLKGRAAENYDTYARNVAEDIYSSCWRAANGDLYLRLLPGKQINPNWKIQTSAKGTQWYFAPDPFNPDEITNITSPSGESAQYWGSPTGELWRRSDNVVSYVEERAGIDLPLLEIPRGRDLVARYKTHHPTGRNVRDQLMPERIDYGQTGKQKQQFPAPVPVSANASLLGNPPLSVYNDRILSAVDVQRLQEANARSGIHDTNRYPRINLDLMLEQFTRIIVRSTEEVLYPPHMFHSQDAIPRDLVDTVMCLNDDEWKYLPLWAGGNDDGTGGVFDEVDVPNLEAGGFRGGKRGLGSRTTGVGGESEGSISSFDDVASDALSTVARASKDATDGTRTVRSVSEAGESENGDFMRQDELWDEIRNMKVADGEGKEKGVEREAEVEEDDGDVSTIMGAGSDVQGDMFHDIDDDDDNGDEIEGQEDGDSDLEIIDMDEL